MDNYAILTNDLQYAAMNKHENRKKSVEVFLPTEINLLNEARKMNIPIIHLQLINKDNDPRAIGQPEELQFTKGTKGVQIISDVLNETDYIIEKYKDSGFFETSLHELLQKLNINVVIITGMQTQICVQTTAADAYFRGYKVIVPSDCCTSTNEKDTQRSLEWMKNYCAKVIKSKDLIILLKKEQHEE